MGTRSSIAIRNSDGTVWSVYCHWDGYVDHNGKLLEENYSSEDAVRLLLSGGDMSALGKSFVETEYYSRDRGESRVQCQAKHSVSLEAWLTDYGQGYDYLFIPDENKWRVKLGDDDFVDLRDALGLVPKEPVPIVKPTYNPIRDEHKEFTHEEWISVAKDALDEYSTSLKNANDFQKGKHTFDTWMASFKRYMSW